MVKQTLYDCTYVAIVCHVGDPSRKENVCIIISTHFLLLAGPVGAVL